MKPILPSHWSVLVNDKAVCMSSEGVNRVFASNESHCVVVAVFDVSSLPPPIISVCVCECETPPPDCVHATLLMRLECFSWFCLLGADRFAHRSD